MISFLRLRNKSSGNLTYSYSSAGNKLVATNYDRLDQSAAYSYSYDRTELKTAKIGAADTHFSSSADQHAHRRDQCKFHVDRYLDKHQ